MKHKSQKKSRLTKIPGKNWKRMGSTLACIALALIIASQNEVLTCKIAGSPAYVEISDGLYVSALIEEYEYGRIEASILDARTRIEETFGKLTSSPKMIITQNSAEADSLGSNATAHSHLSAFGQCLVFGPEGRNVDVFAHELVHAEVHSRIGWLTQLISIPVWFNEGIALIVDYRAPYLPTNIDIRESEVELVKSKNYGYQFFSDDAIKNYQASRLAVDPIDPKLLYSKLEEINSGKSFADAFGL